MMKTLLCSLFLFVHVSVNAQVEFSQKIKEMKIEQTLQMVTPQTFAIISDFGSNDANQKKVAELLNSYDPQFIITAGDNFHVSRLALDSMIKKYYGRYYSTSPALNKFFPVPGNHDITDPVEYSVNANNYLSNYRDYFSALPGNRRYYSLRKGDIEFFMLNSDFGGQYSYCRDKNRVWEVDGIDSNSIQANWLKAMLLNSTAKFKVIAFHYPPYFSFPYDYDTTSTVNCNGVQTPLRLKVDTLFQRLRWPFKKWGADIVINGHTHCGELLEVDGLKYYLQVSGGAPLGSFFSNRNRHSKFFYKTNFGFTLVTNYGDSLLFRLINANNQEVYSFGVVPQKSIRIQVKSRAVNDTLTALLRSTQFPYGVLAEAKRIGAGIFYFPAMQLDKNYILQVSHRNSISVWAKSLVRAGDVIDLTDPGNVEGEQLDGDFMFSGDVDKSKSVDATDYMRIDNAVRSYSSGYIPEDLNNSSHADITDMVIIERILGAYPVEVRK